MKTSNILILALSIAIFSSCNSGKTEKSATTSASTDSTKEVANVPADTTTIDEEPPINTNQLALNGTIDVLPQHIETISSTMGGKVVSTSILPGQSVAAGGVIAVLQNPEFVTLQQQYLDAHAQVEYLKAEYMRQAKLSTEQATSQKKVQQCKADYLSMQSRMEAYATQLSQLGVSARRILSNGIQANMYVRASRGGYIADVMINNGKYVNAGEPMCEIINKHNMLLKLTAYEKDMQYIKIGSSLTFTVNGTQGTFSAKVMSIGQKIDNTTRSLPIYCNITSKNTDFRPGMYVSAILNK